MQDIFVLSMLNGKKNGVYVEIGADQPRVISNTYLLENNLIGQVFLLNSMQIKLLTLILLEKINAYVK